MSSTNRYEKAVQWMREPDKHLHSLIVDEDRTVSAIVVGDTGEYLVVMGLERHICGCPANRLGGTVCSHILFLEMWLSKA